MDIISLLLFFYLSYSNGMRAKRKGLSPFVWGIMTFVSIFLSEMIGMAIVVVYFCRDVININKLTDPVYKDAATKRLAEVVYNNPTHVLTIFLFGIGGYLLLRFIIDRKQNKNDDSPPSHWSDRLGENRDDI